MKKIFILGVIAVMLLATVGAVTAAGPDNAADKNKNVEVIKKPYGSCTLLISGNDKLQQVWLDGTTLKIKYDPKLHMVCKPAK